MRVITIPCLRDNYAYLVICETTGAAAVIDPSQAAPVREALAREGVTLAAIWLTHHHADHTGGVQPLVADTGRVEVIAHEVDARRIAGCTRAVHDGDVVRVGDEIEARVIHNPGHTAGAVSYWLTAHAAVFTGDTLFLAGCGRLFEGTAAQMHASLARLAALPPATRVLCGHEYTAANLRFAARVEPTNAAVAAAMAAVERRGGTPSVPGTIEAERATNPFLRTGEPGVVDAARGRADLPADDPAAVFAALRRWKDALG